MHFANWMFCNPSTFCARPPLFCTHPRQLASGMAVPRLPGLDPSQKPKNPKRLIPPLFSRREIQGLGLNRNSNPERTYIQNKIQRRKQISYWKLGIPMVLTCPIISSLLSLSQLSLSLVMSVNNWRC